VDGGDDGVNVRLPTIYAIQRKRYLLHRSPNCSNCNDFALTPP